MTADLEHGCRTLASRVQGDLRLLRSLRWSGKFVANIGPCSLRCLIPWEPPEPPAAPSVSNTPVCGTWSDSTSNKLQVGHQMHWCGLGCVVFFFFFFMSDKWKEHCVTNACRIVSTVMLSVVGGVSLLWWWVFLKLLVLNALCDGRTQLSVYCPCYTAGAALRDWLYVWFQCVCAFWLSSASIFSPLRTKIMALSCEVTLSRLTAVLLLLVESCSSFNPCVFLIGLIFRKKAKE